ncbi:MAG: NUDIX hydrolase [Deltaproteobacteria bacterium]|nr:NUDIX hydrolase [Deltaproteobacteria bacterium]
MQPHQARLLALLEHFLPADDLEERHLEAIRALVSSSADCFSRTHWVPGHITGSAFIVDPARRQMLLHHHKKLDRWLQMGGHDDGERDAAATALREAREESGLAKVEWPPGERRVLDVDVHEIPARKEDPAHQHHDVRFLFYAESTQPLSMDAQESNALAWIPLADAAAKMGEEGAKRVVAKIDRLLASHQPPATSH